MISEEIEQTMLDKILEAERPRRRVLTARIPLLSKPVVAGRRFVSKIRNLFRNDIAREKSLQFFDCVVARHQSVLIRKLGDSDMRLQKQKVQNLRLAAEALNGLVIYPGEVFSFWETIGKPTREKGYVDGMLLSNGRVVEGVGGGLCQMSNLLCWLMLHGPLEIVERYHHSLDVFPDSGRVLPFGSGATVFYNYVDLKMKNISNQPLQLKVWLTDEHLKAQLLTVERMPEKYHVFQKDHSFARKSGRYYRFNEICREKKVEGQVVAEEKIFTNFAPVLYEIDDQYVRENGHELVVFETMKDLVRLVKIAS
ncbi:MAG: VanW family protein [Candidatus Gracilibacteria bacterium]